MTACGVERLGLVTRLLKFKHLANRAGSLGNEEKTSTKDLAPAVFRWLAAGSAECRSVGHGNAITRGGCVTTTFGEAETPLRNEMLRPGRSSAAQGPGW